MKSLSLLHLNSLKFKELFAGGVNGETIIPGALSAGATTPTWGRY